MTPPLSSAPGEAAGLRIAVVGDVHAATLATRADEAETVRCALWSPAEPADLILVNLEGPLTDFDEPREAKRYPFRAPPVLAGLFDKRCVLALANNHMLDYGARGLADTLAALDARGLAHAGAGPDLDAAARPAIVERNGRRIGILCAADPRYQAAGPGRAGTLPADEERLVAGLRALRDTADLALAVIHMGLEFIPYPSPRMRALAACCAREGAAAVVFHHAHCAAGWSRIGSTAVLWGTGNYLFDPEGDDAYAPWFESAAWRLDVPAGTRSVANVDVVPVRLDRTGFPRRAAGRDAERLRRRFELRGRRALTPGRAALYRTLYLANPAYLRIALPGFFWMLRRDGVRGLARYLRATTAAQFKRGGTGRGGAPGATD